MPLQENSWVDFDAFTGVIHKSTVWLLSSCSKSGSWTLWVTPTNGFTNRTSKCNLCFECVTFWYSIAFVNLDANLTREFSWRAKVINPLVVFCSFRVVCVFRGLIFFLLAPLNAPCLAAYPQPESVSHTRIIGLIRCLYVYLENCVLSLHAL